MIEEVDIVFNYGGNWVISPKLGYNIKFQHTWYYNTCLVCYDDLCEAFTSKFGFKEVQQLLVTSPSGTYYVIEDNDGIKTLQYLFSKDFKVINFYAVDAHELRVSATNMIYHTESYSVDVEAATDCDYSDVEDETLYEMGNNCEIVEYNAEVLQRYEHEKERVVSDGLEKFKELEMGMTFKTIQEARQVVSFYAMANKKKMKTKKSDTKRIRYECYDGCPFTLLISKDGKSATFKVKTLKPKHTCGDSFVNPLATYHTLAVYFKDEVQNNPKYPIKDMRGILEKKFKLNVSRSKLKRAKTMALDKLEGSFKDDYNRLEAYGQELRQSNPGSDVVINISKDALDQGIRRFLRMYICFKALKDGWKSLRPIIGLDGTFLKGKCKGQLLVAVGQDSMNHFYPIAWAVVEKENTGTWTWFIQLLRISLELKNGEIVTFMSDMQKGLLDVVANVVPEAHHRFCVRHIESNWCKKWRSGEEKKLMWWCAWSTYEEEFKDTLKVLGKVDKDSASDLLHFPVIKWCRAYFDTQCKNLMVDNNFTESFNSWILEARQKPIIKMLEEIRVKVMNMLVKNEKMGRKWQNDISPTAMKLYNDYRLMATNCTVEFNGDYGYEVKDGDTDTHTVNLELKKCTCRLWDLGGIPCHHAIKALLHKKTEPLEEVHYWYRKEAYLLTYKHKLQPVRGSQFWKIDPAQAMEPPEMVKLVGRPKMKRNRETDEASLRKGAWKQSRKGTLMRCNKCGDFNHNAKGCYKDHEDGESSHERNKKASNQKSRSRAGKNSTCSATVEYETEASPQQFQTQQSTAYGPEIGNEEDPALRPMVISETETMMEKRSRIFEGIGSRKIVFKGDARGISTPSDLPYSPKKTTWKGKKAVTTDQLQAEVKKKKVKQMAMKGKWPVDTDDDLV